ncbi:MAG: nucleotidyltransferase [Crocinitomicaceae bacterium]|nr:nucleotidyltransferase [Crocinitomicaceae bacterium]
MPPVTEERQTVKKSLLESFCYFDIFSYPLSLNDLKEFGTHPFETKDLEELIKDGVICQKNGFYALSDSDADVRKRIAGNERAVELEQKAIQQALFIGQFPFVRSVSLSGSMSKGYMDEEADLDFFVITTPQRLWIARTLLILYKKIFLLNSKKYFCVNYFVDTDHMEIEEKNRFTATEVVTLRNVYGKEVHQAFLKANQWAFDIYPNYRSRHLPNSSKPSFFKKKSEQILTGKLGEQFDIWCFKKTLNRWENKFGKMDEKDFQVAFKSRRSVSKHHPNNFQRIVLERLEKKLQEVKSKYNISWD